MKTVYDRIASRYDTLHGRWLRHAGGEAQSAFEAALLARISAGTRYLDAGCGTGRFARHILVTLPEQPDITLLDNCPAMLEHVRDLPVRRVEGCLVSMPFGTETFDLVSAAWSIEATGDPARAVRELLRVLRPGGHLVLVFCADLPTNRLSARVLRQSVQLRKTGRFLDAGLMADVVEDACGERPIRMRCDGPAAVMVVRKPAQAAAMNLAA